MKMINKQFTPAGFSPAFSCALAILAAALLLPGSAHGATYLFWNGASGVPWETNTNWSTIYSANTAASADPTLGANDIAMFSRVAGAATVDLGATTDSALGLYFQNTNVATSLVSTAGSASTLTIGTAGIHVGYLSGVVTIGASSTAPNSEVNIALSGSQTWTNVSAYSPIFTVLNGVTNASSTTPVSLTLASDGAYNNGFLLAGPVTDGGALAPTALTVALGATSGTATLTGSNGASTYTGATTVSGGTLLLDFSQSNGVATNIINNGLSAGNGSALVLGGATQANPDAIGGSQVGTFAPPVLTIKGLSGATDSQTFNGTTVAAGLSIITLNQNSAASLTLNLGNITRSGSGVLDFSAVPTASNIVSTSKTNDGTGILGDWIVVGGTGAVPMTYATASGGNVAAYSAPAASANLAGITAGNNYSYSAAATLAASSTANTLTYTGAATNTTLTGVTLGLNGLLQAGSGALGILNGTLGIGANNELVITSAGNAITISSVIANNSTSGVAGNLTITNLLGGSPGAAEAATNLITLSTANTYTGTTTINSGYVAPGVLGALGNGGNITFNGGWLYLNGAAESFDYSSRFMNSPSPIGLDYSGNTGAQVALNGVIGSSNTGGLNIRLGSLTDIAINGVNSYSGVTEFDGSPGILTLGNAAALGTSSLINSAGSGFAIQASTDLTGANSLPNNIYESANGLIVFQGGHSITLTGTLGRTEDTGEGLYFNDMYAGTLTVANRYFNAGSLTGGGNLYWEGFGNTNFSGVIATDVTGTGAAAAFQIYNTGATTFGGSANCLGGLYIGGGVLNLNFAGPNSPGSNILFPTQAVALVGATMILTGTANTNNSQTVSTLNSTWGANTIVLTPGASGNIVLNATGGSALPVGTTLNVVLGGLNGSSSSINGFITTTATDSFGLLRAATVNGTDWAATQTAGAISGSNVVAYTGYVTVPSASAWASNGNKNITDTTSPSSGNAFGSTLLASSTIGSLRFNYNGGPGSPTISAAATLTVADGILVSSNVSGQAETITGGTLQGKASSDLLVINNGVNGTSLGIGSAIVNNGAAATAFTKAGAGLVSLTGVSNTYTGITYIDQGALAGTDSVNTVEIVAITTTAGSAAATLASAAGLVSGSTYDVFGAGVSYGTTFTYAGSTSVTLSATASAAKAAVNMGVGAINASGNLSGASNINLIGGVIEVAGTFNRSLGAGPGQVQFNTFTPGGFAAASGTSVVNLGGAGSPLVYTWATGLYSNSGVAPSLATGGNSLANASTMILGDPTAQGMVNFENPISMSQTAVFDVIQGSNSANIPIDAELSGAVTTPSAVYGYGVVKAGNGTLWVASAANSWYGDTVVDSGELTLNSTGNIPLASNLDVSGATSIFNTGTNWHTSANVVTLANGGSIIAAANGGATGSAVTSSTLTGLSYNLQSGSVTGVNLAGAGVTMTKTTSGTVTINSNCSYTGSSSILAGNLVISGSLSGAGTVSVGDPNNPGTFAILAGSGVVGNVTLGAASGNTGAEVDPSNAPLNVATENVGIGGPSTGTTLTVTSFTIGGVSGATLALQVGREDFGGLDQTTEGNDSSDRIALKASTGAISLGTTGNLELTLQSGYTPVAGDILYLIIGSGVSISGQFATANGSPISSNAFIADGYNWTISYTASATAGQYSGAGDDIAIEAGAAVPEPGTWAMFLGGFGMLLGFQRRLRRRE